MCCLTPLIATFIPPQSILQQLLPNIIYDWQSAVSPHSRPAGGRWQDSPRCHSGFEKDINKLKINLFMTSRNKKVYFDAQIKKKYVFNVVHIWPGWVPPPPSVRRTKGHQTSRSTHPDGHNCFLCQKFSHQNTLMVINCFPCQKFSHQNNFPFQNFCHHHLLVEVNASNPPGVLHVSTVGWAINNCTFVQLQIGGNI